MANIYAEFGINMMTENLYSAIEFYSGYEIRHLDNILYGKVNYPDLIDIHWRKGGGIGTTAIAGNFNVAKEPDGLFVFDDGYMSGFGVDEFNSFEMISGFAIENINIKVKEFNKIMQTPSKDDDIIFYKQIFSGPDVFVGNKNSKNGNYYLSYDGDDHIYSGGGNDYYDAGQGLDTVHFSGNRADYTLLKAADGTYTVTDTIAGRDGVDTVRNAEKFQFRDQTMDLGSSVSMTDLFSAKPDIAKGLASAYEVLLAGVPSEAGFTFLINSAVSTNFGAGAGVVFNQENIFINLVNNLVQGNASAKARFDTLAAGATLEAKVTSLYNGLIPASKQSAEGLAFITRADGLKFYQDVAAERGVAGTDGAAIVSLASLLKIVVTGDYGVGNAVNDLIKAVAAGSAAIPATGTTLTPLETADGTAFDADDAAALARMASASATSEVYASPFETQEQASAWSVPLIGQADGHDGAGTF